MRRVKSWEDLKEIWQSNAGPTGITRVPEYRLTAALAID